MMLIVRSRLRSKPLHRSSYLGERDAESREKRWSAKGRAAGLTGWQQIVAFPGHPGAVVQRWASEGTVHAATEDTDFAAELKRGLALPRREKEPNAAKKQIAHPKKARRR